MSRRGTPLRSIVDLTIGAGAVGIAYLGNLLDEVADETKDITLKSIETTSEMLSRITQYTGLYSVYSLLVKIVELIAKVPELIVTLIKKCDNFFLYFLYSNTHWSV